MIVRFSELRRATRFEEFTVYRNRKEGQSHEKAPVYLCHLNRPRRYVALRSR